MTTGEAAVVVRGLVKQYGARRVLDGVSFDVAAGEIFGLIGPNGAGKTTTVEILEGYRAPDGGSVRVLGVDPIADGARLRPRIGVMLQEGGLYPGLKCVDVLNLFAAYYDTADDPAELLERVGLSDAARTVVRRLSGGQRQRLSLACALVGRPELVFLDEPTAGMDPHARATTWRRVRELADAGVSVVLTTHAMDEAEALCDRVAILVDGTLAAIGSPSELTSGAHAEAVEFRSSAALDRVSLAEAIGVAASAIDETRPGAYLMRCAASPNLVASLALWLREQGALLESFSTGSRSLEAVFLQLTAEESGASADANVPS